MLKNNELISLLIKKDLTFVTGVPCSIFKDFLIYINDTGKLNHVPATSEGEACAIASGYYLATKKIPMVYMQNSGLGNSINPLTSLLDKAIYGIPALLLISWRGEPGKKDEPQHIKMGRITLKLLKTLSIPFSFLPPDQVKAAKEIEKAKLYLKKNGSPYAIIVKKETIESCQSKAEEKNIYSLTREEAIKIILANLKGDEAIISTTGKTSRELFECREIKKQNHRTDFYVVGSMGCSAGIALGIALTKPRKKIFIFDGDGSVLMKMGTLATIGHFLPKNLFHIIFDNNTYDSTGGQKTVSNSADFSRIALACGYKSAKIATTQKELVNFVKTIKFQKCPSMLIVKIKRGSRKNLGRPTKTPQENKIAFMKFLQNK
ncbi:MAG: phosphonopyruvate decarboxylase [Candidatus Portnoybacteria bacterium RBG_13_40_8]|uniref:Phosphonopyruvate decarboxylase n=1 Tax=Candidatus Portnoybacteria bacterium RBG_13_40_8 TaxID=1801990 RepID=A0A1G2F585_9BACT|nr:MAG: phosphonopyruvate decarboxylase [Candidatus Portnoybacteria bacterium RBG_13_40_8]